MTLNPLVDLRIGSIAREFEAMRADARRMIPSILPEWTYTNSDDFGIALLELALYFADHLHYRADATYRDVLPTRSPHREIVREYAEWLGYLARRATPAEVDVVLTAQAAPGEDVAVPRGFRLSGNGPDGAVTFELSDEVLLLSDATTVAAHAVEGTTVYRALLGTSTGAPGEKFSIPHSDAIFNWDDADIVVEIGTLEATHYRYPALLEPNTLGYWVRLGPSGLLEVRTGDGVYGRTLPPGVGVYCTYRRGGGLAGNVSAGKIAQVLDSVYLVDGTEVPLTVSNAEAASGGAPEETVESIRVQAPAAFATQDRAVSHEDYVSHALRVGGVFRARVATYGVNGVRVFVVPTGVDGGAVVSRALIAQVVRALDRVRMCTDCVSVEAAKLVPVDVVIAMRAKRMARNGVVREAVRQRFVGETTGLFCADLNDLGRTLWFSDMVGAIEGVVGVDNFDVTRYCRRPQLAWASTTGDAALSDTGVTINGSTRAQTWYLEMVSPTEYTVRGSLSGLQSRLGVLDELFSDDLGEVSWTLEAGSVAVTEGDRAEVVVGALIGNIALGANEFPVFDKYSVTVSVTGGLGA